MTILKHGVLASQDWSLEYRLYPDQELDTPEVRLLDRQRRYVPLSEPLDEYVHQQVDDKSKFITNPGNTPSGRQNKEIKFSPDGRPSAIPQTSLSDNTAARPPPPPPPTSPSSTTTRPTTSPPSKEPGSIISAAFDNGNGAGASTEASDEGQELPLGKNIDDIWQSTMKQNNITQKMEDHHIYYNSTFLIDSQIGQSYWVDMNKRDDVKVNNMLSKSHRRAATVKLSFDFPFYGHVVRNVTIATGGFLYTGEYVHSWLAATQYIAPLMANFDTSISNDSFIKYIDNGTAFTVQWEKVVLQDKPTDGAFTFQATLHSTGDIVFVYQNIPMIIEHIMDDQHPVKVGLSDAYIIDRTIFFVRRKTIYEYHRVNFKQEDIKNWTVIYLNALPTCIEKKDCSSCVSAKIGFECKWCPGANRCSTGMDRKRQEWLYHECDRSELSEPQHCEEQQQETIGEPQTHLAVPNTGEEGGGVRMGSGYLGAAFFLVLIAGVAVWALYAYSNPHSYSGQILIRYRPSQWSWRRGEARYTAATIHM